MHDMIVLKYLYRYRLELDMFYLSLRRSHVMNRVATQILYTKKIFNLILILYEAL